MRSNNFTTLHMIGALLVLVGHAYVFFGLETPAILHGGWTLHEMGVGILFMVSGYLNTLSYIRNQDKKARAGRYMLKRLLRLYPALLVCLLATVAVMRLVTTTPEAYWPQARQYLIDNLKLNPTFRIAGVFEDNIYPGAINGSLWTLPVEVVCYVLLIPVLELALRLPKKAGIAVSGALMIAFALFSPFRVYFPAIPSYLILWGTDWMVSTRLIMMFLIGVFMGLCDIRKYLRWQAALVLVLVFACLTGKVRLFIEPFVYSYVAMCFGEAEKPMFAKAFKADICYGLYLYAFPVSQLIIQLLVVRRRMALPFAVYVALCIGVTWGIAVLNHWLVEKPMSKIGFLRRIT